MQTVELYSSDNFIGGNYLFFSSFHYFIIYAYFSFFLSSSHSLSLSFYGCGLVDPDCCLMTSTDQDRLNELIFANGVWAELEPNSVDAARHEHGCPSKLDMVNMAEGAIRRMIKMVKRIEAFRSIEHHDQILILRSSLLTNLLKLFFLP